MYYVIIFILCLSCNVFASDQLMTVCHVMKTTYVNIIPYDSIYKQDKATNYSVEEKKTGETYTLLIEDNKINIHYKSKNNPMFNWSMNEELNRDNGERAILNQDPKNLIIRTYYANQQEQIYYFNLDNSINGYLTIVNTRWKSLLDAYNSQALYFCECKGVK